MACTTKINLNKPETHLVMKEQSDSIQTGNLPVANNQRANGKSPVAAAPAAPPGASHADDAKHLTCLKRCRVGPSDGQLVW